MTTPHNLVGRVFGRLTVIERDTRSVKSKWHCLCECGNKKAVLQSNLVGKRTLSCGCLQKERAIASNLTHNMTDTPEYKSWAAMVQRCTNPKNPSYADYGSGCRLTPSLPTWARALTPSTLLTASM